MVNQLRVSLFERGMVFALNPAKLKAAMADVLENAETCVVWQFMQFSDTGGC